jgi:hypothetical protein
MRANFYTTAGSGFGFVLIAAEHAGISYSHNIGIAASRGDATITGAEAAVTSH